MKVHCQVGRHFVDDEIEGFQPEWDGDVDGVAQMRQACCDRCSALAVRNMSWEINQQTDRLAHLRLTGERRDLFRGYDDEGDVVVAMDLPGPEEFLVPLTPCCLADGKGTVNAESGVCCRACYAEVDPKYGGRADLPLIITAKGI